MSTSTRFAEILCAVVERGTYTAAAQQLEVTPAAISRAVARQERHLGVRLLERTTRSMNLTDAGQRYYERCQQALALLRDAEHEVALQGREPRGRVRISVPTTYGHYRLFPVLADFANRYPRVELEVHVSNDTVDLVGERYDLAVRRGDLQDSSLIARKLEDADVGVFASPAYLARHGVPDRPESLLCHTCLPFVHPRTGRVIPWGFIDADGQPQDLVAPQRVRCSGDFLGCLAMARSGAGVVQAYRFLVERELREGTLVELLRRFAGRSSPFSLVRPARGGESAAVRRLAEAIVAHCAGPIRAKR